MLCGDLLDPGGLLDGGRSTKIRQPIVSIGEDGVASWVSGGGAGGGGAGRSGSHKDSRGEGEPLQLFLLCLYGGVSPHVTRKIQIAATMKLGGQGEVWDHHLVTNCMHPLYCRRSTGHVHGEVPVCTANGECEPGIGGARYRGCPIHPPLMLSASHET